MKDFLKLFKTFMDLKGLTFLVLKQSMIKKLRPVFFWPWLLVLCLKKDNCSSRLRVATVGRGRIQLNVND